MPRAENLLPAADLLDAGFAITNVETEDDIENNSVSYYVSRDSVEWGVSLEITEPGREPDQAWNEILEYVRVVAEPGEPVERVTGVGDEAVYWADQLYVRAGPAVIHIEAEAATPDPATARLLCVWLAHRVLARMWPATFQPPRGLRPPPPATAPTKPPTPWSSEDDADSVSDAGELRRFEVSIEWLNAHAVKALERDRKWLRYKISQSGPNPDPDLLNALADVESALETARTPPRNLTSPAPDHPLTSQWTLVSPRRQRKLLLRRWNDLVPGQAKVGKRLVDRYDTRRLHTLIEILTALPLLDANATDADDPAAVELAVWFHAAGGDTPSGEPDVEAAVREAWHVLRDAGMHDARATEVIRLLRLQATGHISDADRNGTLLSSILHCFLLRTSVLDDIQDR